jgi:hypothetical protein
VITIEGGEISGNVAAGGTGGMDINAGTVNYSRDVIANNTSDPSNTDSYNAHIASGVTFNNSTGQTLDESNGWKIE